MYEEYRYIRCQLPDTLNLSPARSEWMMQHDTVHHTEVSDCYNDRIQFLRDCEYHMIIGCTQYILLLGINPFFFRKLLTHGATPASARVIVNADTSTVLTDTDVHTKSPGFTVHDVKSCFSVVSRKLMCFFINRIKPFKDILYRTRFFHDYSPPISSNGLLIPSRVLLLT